MLPGRRAFREPPPAQLRKIRVSEAGVKRGDRVVGDDKELLEKLGNRDLCPCRSGRRFARCCRNSGRFRRRQPPLLPPRLTTQTRRSVTVASGTRGRAVFDTPVGPLPSVRREVG
ncbi:MAG: SEC-C domain-containing protein [Actinomycetia bacterium]|nr:SEC-C domain-containing protein [Actinomycetes bacterium]